MNKTIKGLPLLTGFGTVGTVASVVGAFALTSDSSLLANADQIVRHRRGTVEGGQ